MRRMVDDEEEEEEDDDDDDDDFSPLYPKQSGVALPCSPFNGFSPNDTNNTDNFCMFLYSHLVGGFNPFEKY